MHNDCIMFFGLPLGENVCKMGLLSKFWSRLIRDDDSSTFSAAAGGGAGQREKEKSRYIRQVKEWNRLYGKVKNCLFLCRNKRKFPLNNNHLVNPNSFFWDCDQDLEISSPTPACSYLGNIFWLSE